METEPRAEAPTGQLLQEAASEAKGLVSQEIDLATDDLRRTLREGQSSVVALGVGAVAGVAGLNLLLLSIAFANRHHPVRTAALGLGLLGAAGAAVAIGLAAFPARPLAATRDRIVKDVELIKEKIG